MNPREPRLDPRRPAFLQKVKTAQDSIGRRLLTDEEVLLLAAEEISRTSTREEKNYNT
jgi:hypothetical protein